jgi:CsoR family transcriptional regulator, copper-sensing transcriptional repressor
MPDRKERRLLPAVGPLFVTDERRLDVRRRLNRVRGQVDGIERMIDANRPCAEILQQIGAAQEALRAAGKLMVRNYVEKCAAEGIRAGRAKDVSEELIQILDRMIR